MRLPKIIKMGHMDLLYKKLSLTVLRGICKNRECWEGALLSALKTEEVGNQARYKSSRN